MRQPDLLWEAAMTAVYGDKTPILTQSERKKTGKLLNELREIGATPEDLLARAKQYPRVMPKDCILTLAALVNNWTRCQPPKTPKRGTTAAHEIWVSPWEQVK
jgi:hypothetical protein